MSVQSLDRAFDILEFLAHQQEAQPLAIIAEELKLNKSTVHRLLNSLKTRGYVEQEAVTGRYRLGLGFIGLSSQYLNKLEIKTEAEPYLQNLSLELGETVFLAVLKENEVVYIDKFEQVRSLRRYSIIGSRAPLHCTSLGKALLLDKSVNELKEILASLDLKSYTEHTITQPETFLEELAKLRIQGWTRDNQEHENGVSCIGAPIRDYRGTIIAAISSAWEGSFKGQSIETTAKLLLDTAQTISKQLGYFISHH